MIARLRPVLAVPFGIFLAGWLVVAHHAVRVHTLQPDEVIPIAGSRHVLADPLSAFGAGSQLSGRGLERGVAVSFAFLQWLLGNTAQALWAEHVLIAGVFAATALVIWSWARELDLEPWQAGIAAALSLCVPWLIYGTSYLNSAGAYCLTPLALYAIWRAIVAPGIWRDVVALAALLLLGCVRVGNVVIAVAFPAGIVLHAIYARPPGVGMGRALRELPRRVWRDHPLLVVLGALGVLALVAGGTRWLIGGYPTRAAVFSNFRIVLRAELAALAVGTAIVPVVVALAWFARSLVRPSSARLGAFAAVAVSAFLVLVYVASTQGIEERYLAPMAPVIALAFVIALARREAPVILVGLSGLLVARLIAINGPGSDLFGAYQYFQSTGVAFFRRVVLGKASLALPAGDHHVLTTVVVACVLVAVAGAVLVDRRPRLVLGALALGAAVWGAAAGGYAMHQFVQQAGFPALTYDQQAWIDGRAGPGAHAALAGAGLEGVQRELAVFNRSLGSPYAPRTFEPGSADVGTGLLAADAPRWLVQSEGFQPVGVDADVVASSTYLPTRVLLRRLRSPGRLVYRVLSPGPFKVRVYGTGCMRISFQAPPGSAGSHPWRLVSPAGTARGILHGETSATVQRPLSGGTYEDFVLFAKGGANVSEIARTPC